MIGIINYRVRQNKSAKVENNYYSNSVSRCEL